MALCGELVVLHTRSSMFIKCLVHAQKQFIEVSMNILHEFIESHTHFVMSRVL